MNNNTPTEKDCTRCGVIKPLTDFYKSPTGRYGRHSWCKQCQAEHTGHKYTPRKQSPVDGYKYCATCGILKPLDEFFTDRSMKSGLTSRCKECHSKANGWKHGKLAYLKEIPEEPEGLRWCLTCKQLKPIDQFGIHFDGEQSRRRRHCFDCRKIESKEHRKNNPEYYHAYVRRNDVRERKRKSGKRLYSLNSVLYRQIATTSGQRRRARENGLPDTLAVKQWRRALRYFDYRCAICGATEGFWIQIVQGHWIPVSDPRPDNPGTVATNIIPICHPKSGIPIGEPTCNISQGNKDPIEWINERYNKKRAKEIIARIMAYFDWIRREDKTG